MKTIERAILQVLADAHPHMMPDRRLFGAVNIECANAVTRADFDRAIAALQTAEGGAQIFGTNPTGDGAKWKITPEGLARLANA